MHKAVFSFSFDDGRADNFEIFSSLFFQNNIPVTLNVTTGYIDGTCSHDRMPTDKKALSITDIQTISKNPLVELALHGNNHDNTPEDINEGRQKLLKWLDYPEDHVFGFASPGSGFEIDDFIHSNEPLFKDQIAYMRHSLRITDHAFLRTYSRKAARVWHRPELYRIAYKNTIMYDCPDRIIYSIPIMKDITARQIIAMIDLCVQKKGALTFMLHSIAEDDSQDDSWTWKKEKLESVINYLLALKNNEKAEIVTTMELYGLLTK